MSLCLSVLCGRPLLLSVLGFCLKLTPGILSPLSMCPPSSAGRSLLVTHTLWMHGLHIQGLSAALARFRLINLGNSRNLVSVIDFSLGSSFMVNAKTNAFQKLAKERHYVTSHLPDVIGRVSFLSLIPFLSFPSPFPSLFPSLLGELIGEGRRPRCMLCG